MLQKIAVKRTNSQNSCGWILFSFKLTITCANGITFATSSFDDARDSRCVAPFENINMPPPTCYCRRLSPSWAGLVSKISNKKWAVNRRTSLDNFLLENQSRKQALQRRFIENNVVLCEHQWCWRIDSKKGHWRTIRFRYTASASSIAWSHASSGVRSIPPLLPAPLLSLCSASLSTSDDWRFFRRDREITSSGFSWWNLHKMHKHMILIFIKTHSTVQKSSENCFVRTHSVSDRCHRFFLCCSCRFVRCYCTLLGMAIIK